MATRVRLRLYIYPKDAHGMRAVRCKNVRGDKDLFESKLPELLRHGDGIAGLLIVQDASHADLLYHPACLIDYFFQVRAAATFRLKVDALEQAVLRDINESGQAHKPHIVHALRCLGAGRKGRLHDFNHITKAYRSLWRGERFGRFCTETELPVDPISQVHVPYCPMAAPPPMLALPETARVHRVVYIGSPLFGRSPLLRTLHAQNFSRRVIILNPFRRGGRPGELWCDANHPLHTRLAGQRVIHGGENCTGVSELMWSSVFTLCPAGDTPDPLRMYSAFAHGSIPILERQSVLPPITNWSTLTVPVRVSAASGVLELPSAAEQRSLLASVWRFRSMYSCEPGNMMLLKYLVSRLADVVNASQSDAHCNSAIAATSSGTVWGGVMGCVRNGTQLAAQRSVLKVSRKSRSHVESERGRRT